MPGHVCTASLGADFSGRESGTNPGPPDRELIVLLGAQTVIARCVLLKSKSASPNPQVRTWLNIHPPALGNHASNRVNSLDVERTWPFRSRWASYQQDNRTCRNLAWILVLRGVHVGSLYNTLNTKRKLRKSAQQNSEPRHTPGRMLVLSGEEPLILFRISPLIRHADLLRPASRLLSCLVLRLGLHNIAAAKFEPLSRLGRCLWSIGWVSHAIQRKKLQADPSDVGTIVTDLEPEAHSRVRRQCTHRYSNFPPFHNPQ